MLESHNSGSNDFSDKFAPVWNLYKKTRLFVLAVWVFVFLISAGSLYKLFVFKEEWLGLPVSITILWVLYTFFTLKCPNCSKPTGGFVDIVWHKCPYCGAILFKRSSETIAKAKIFSAAIIIIIFLLIIAAILKGMKIERNTI